MLRTFIRTEAIHRQARTVTRKALNEITPKTSKAIATAAARLIEAFRTSTVDHDRPYSSEMTFFWRYVLEDGLQNLMWRLSALVTPTASKRIVQEATVVVLIHQARKELELCPISPHDPMRATMRERGTVTHRISRQLRDTLATGEEDESLSWVDTDEALGISPPRKQVRCRRGGSKNRVATIPAPEYSCATSSSLDGVQRGRLEPPRGETTFQGLGLKQAATRSQHTTIP